MAYRPTGKQAGDHLRNVRAVLPPGVKQIYGRVDSGFYCREAVEANEEFDARFVISARQTSPVGRGTAPSGVEAGAQDGCRYGMRIPVPAGGMEQIISVRGPALREESEEVLA